jgi:hypothetical protein
MSVMELKLEKTALETQQGVDQAENLRLHQELLVLKEQISQGCTHS